MASVLNNVTSLTAQRNLAQTQKGLSSTINRLSTGLRVNRASDDAAGLQISNNLRADIRILGQAQRNANDGIGIIQIADGVLEEASSLLTRAAELAEQAASGHTSSAGRAALNQEFSQLITAINNMGTDTNYDGTSLFGGSFAIQVGDASVTDVTVAISTLSATTLGVNTNNLSTSTAAQTALTAIQSAISTLSSTRGNLGASEARLNTVINTLNVTRENVIAAESQIRDADIASEVINLTKFQILSQSGVSALAQSNLQAQSVLSLLG
jgi:flagellin